MPDGLEHIPGQVSENMNRWRSDTLVIAQELVWLSKVLPAAAAGDFNPFDAQDTMARKYWHEQFVPMFKMMCNLNPTNCQVALNILLAQLSLAEEQLYTWAFQLGQ